MIETRLLAKAVESVMSPAPVKRRSVAIRFLTGFALTLAFAACVSLALGVFMWLDEIYPTRQALLIFGLGGVIFASLTGSAVYAVSHWRKIKLRIAKKVVERKVHSLFDAVVEEFEVPVKLYPKTAASLAALAGVAVGDKLGEKGARALHDLIHPEGETARTLKKTINHALH